MADELVLAGPASEELGKSVASELGLDLVRYESKVFPDGESRFTINSKVSGKSVFLVQSTYPPIDQHIIQLLLISHHLSLEGAKVTAVVPYLAYARQDKAFLPGEVVSLGVLSHLLRSVGVRRVVTVDIHSAEGLALFSSPIYSVSAIPDLVNHAKNKLHLKNPIVIAPDFGASKKVEAFAALYGTKHLRLKKTRDKVTGEVRVEKRALAVEGMEVLIVDDVISTGDTIRATAEAVLEQGATKTIAICVHPLLVGDAPEKLSRAGVKEIIGTNTVNGRFSVVDVSDTIASHLRTLDE